MIDWTKPICLDTVPPRMARVVDRDDDDDDFPCSVSAHWGAFGDTGREYTQWCSPDGVTILASKHVVEMPTVRNVRPGDFPATPDPRDALMAELVEALREADRALHDEGYTVTHRIVVKITAALAKWEASQ